MAVAALDLDDVLERCCRAPAGCLRAGRRSSRSLVEQLNGLRGFTRARCSRPEDDTAICERSSVAGVRLSSIRSARLLLLAGRSRSGSAAPGWTRGVLHRAHSR